MKLSLTVMQPDNSTQAEEFEVDEKSFANVGLTYDQVVVGYARADDRGNVQEIVVGDKHIPVRLQYNKASLNTTSFSFITVNQTMWTVSLKNFTNITVEDFEEDETLRPVEVMLDWSLPEAGDPQPMAMVLTSAARHNSSMVSVRHNRSNDDWQLVPPEAVLSLRVVNPYTQQATLTTHFTTDLVDLELEETLSKLTEERIAFLIAYPSFSSPFGAPVRDFLSLLGSFAAQHLRPRDMWAWAWRVGGSTLGEGLVTNIMGAANGKVLPPLHLEVTLPAPKWKEPKLCRQWPDNWNKRQHFCELYDGYGDLCSCSAPFIASIPANITKPEMWREDLGVVIMASSRPHYLYRLLRQLMTQPGVTLDQIMVSVDGPEYLETIKLVNLLGLKYQIHQPEGDWTPRISRHLRFALFRALNLLSVDKFIILEEDLMLSPDFIMYMQQTSVLLDEDQSIYAVSAFSHFSYNHVAHDPTRLTRVHSFPAYGWMVKRDFLRETLPKWPPVYVAVDWDYWMGTDVVRLGREVVIPEVPRTAHLGVAGVHFQGPDAKKAFLNRAFSHSTDIQLNVTRMKKDDYEEEMKALLSSAVPLNITHLFSFSFPREGGVFAVCVHMRSLFDKSAFRLVSKALGLWNRDIREGHYALWRVPYYHSLILIIGVPYSKYSHNYLQRGCPVLRATPKMETFLDYDFESKREDVYPPQDFHSILEIPLDSEKSQTTLHVGSEEDQFALDINNEQNQATLIRQEQNHTDFYVQEQNQTALPDISEVNQTALPVISEVNQTALPVISEVNQTALPVISEVNQTALPVISEVNQTALPGISEVNQTALPGISEVNQTALPGISEVNQTALPVISEVNQTALPGISEVNQTDIRVKKKENQSSFSLNNEQTQNTFSMS
ncbi:protein O-linked-mannose beta-1,2-N-acetylglucosaminyltransferase 1-like isoform X2 [Eriocheir sinensis]|nr:protein O-linked-mannose beta-1,2-N-acetylglucosaminyltransferase 1-like isoform X2 [Eriocheir sinensis]